MTDGSRLIGKGLLKGQIFLLSEGLMVMGKNKQQQNDFFKKKQGFQKC